MRMPGVAMPWLVGYYGVFQAGHVVFNVVYLSGLRPIQEFPWPPADGWHPPATAFCTATGLIDTAIALLALYFVAAFFGGRRRVLWAGLVSLATYMCTIFAFNYTVVATGAWAQHPVEYVVLNATTIPLVLPVRGGHSQRAGGSRRRGQGEDGRLVAFQGRVALGPLAGARVQQAGDPLAAAPVPPRPGRCHAHHHGFDLHAELCVPADRRDRLERLCRYVLRPPVAQERLHLTAAGNVRLTLKRPWADGTTHLELEPLDLLARLAAALTPRPRINLVLYHGVLAPRAAWRGLVVRFEQPAHSGPEVAVYSEAEAAGALTDAAEQASGAVSPPPADNHHWAELMRRSFGIDLLACPRCGGRLALIAIIEDPAVIGRILRHLRLPATIPEPCPARSPPLFLAS